jgi:hypothetical protein
MFFNCEESGGVCHSNVSTSVSGSRLVISLAISIGEKMSTRSKATALLAREHSAPEGAEQRLKELGIELPMPPKPFGTYVEAVQAGNLLFLTGMLPTEGREAKFTGRVGAELDEEARRKAAHLWPRE